MSLAPCRGSWQTELRHTGSQGIYLQSFQNISLRIENCWHDMTGCLQSKLSKRQTSIAQRKHSDICATLQKPQSLSRTRKSTKLASLYKDSERIWKHALLPHQLLAERWGHLSFCCFKDYQMATTECRRSHWVIWQRAQTNRPRAVCPHGSANL